MSPEKNSDFPDPKAQGNSGISCTWSQVSKSSNPLKWDDFQLCLFFLGCGNFSNDFHGYVVMPSSEQSGKPSNKTLGMILNYR